MTEPKLKNTDTVFVKKHILIFNSHFFLHVWQFVFCIDHRSNCILITFVENFVIKVYDVHVSPRRFLLSASPMGLERLEVVAQHKPVKSHPVDRRLHFQVPNNVLTN